MFSTEQHDMTGKGKRPKLHRGHQPAAPATKPDDNGTKPKRPRNQLSLVNARKLQEWVRRHLQWAKDSGLTREQFAGKAGKDLGFPITADNCQGAHKVLFECGEIEIDWPWARGDYRVTRKLSTGRDVNAAIAVLAKGIQGLYEQFGEPNCPEAIEVLANVGLNKAGDDSLFQE